MKTFHIVDGDCCGGTLRQSGLARSRDILSWRDALYTGPAPADLTLRALSRVRSRFWTNGRNADEFEKRDARLRRYKDYEHIALWFGPDCVLCQLSLMQVLSWFREQKVSPKQLSWVALHGGELRPDEMANAYASSRPVTTTQMRLMPGVWRAFRQPSPRPLARLLETDLNADAGLRKIVKRTLQEYPSKRNGLSRLESLLIREIQKRGTAKAAEVVGAILRRETVGDTLLFDMLKSLATSAHPLLNCAESSNSRSSKLHYGSVMKLTSVGKRVLSGRADAIELNRVDRWIGGVHLEGTRVRWRWSEPMQTIVDAA